MYFVVLIGVFCIGFTVGWIYEKVTTWSDDEDNYIERYYDKWS